MSTAPDNDIFISVKHLADLKNFAIAEVPADYRRAIDDWNEHFKEFPQYIKTKPEIVDAGLVHGITAHVENACRLASEGPHELRDCWTAHVRRWAERMYEIAQKEKPEIVESKPFPADLVAQISLACEARSSEMMEQIIKKNAEAEAAAAEAAAEAEAAQTAEAKQTADAEA